MLPVSGICSYIHVHSQRSTLPTSLAELLLAMRTLLRGESSKDQGLHHSILGHFAPSSFTWSALNYSITPSVTPPPPHHSHLPYLSPAQYTPTPIPHLHKPSGDTLVEAKSVLHCKMELLAPVVSLIHQRRSSSQTLHNEHQMYYKPGAFRFTSSLRNWFN